MKIFFFLCLFTFSSAFGSKLSAQSLPEFGEKSEFAVKVAYQNSAEWISKSKQTVKAKLGKGQQLEFRNVFIHRNKAGNRFTCGEVRIRSPKKAQGRYQRFISAARSEVTFLEGKVQDFKSGWHTYCGR